jgi:hypothetical protein
MESVFQTMRLEAQLFPKIAAFSKRNLCFGNHNTKRLVQHYARYIATPIPRNSNSSKAESRTMYYFTARFGYNSPPLIF